MMGKGISLHIEGLAELKRRYGKIPANIKMEVDSIMREVADKFVDRAQAAAPINMGYLKNRISVKPAGELRYEIVSEAPYSAYVEWGTKRRAVIPAEQQSIAAKYKGKGGGSGKGFYDSILEWVKRKGFAAIRTKSGAKSKSIDSQIAQEQAAFAIYLSIIRNGVKPHPFFFVQLPQAQLEIDQLATPAIEKALKQK